MTTNERLDRLQRSVAQIASALHVMGGWRADVNGQTELGAILEEQRQAIEADRRVESSA